MEDIARDYEQMRTVLALIVHGAKEDPTIADRMADAWAVQPWDCDVCHAPFSHWADASAHKQAAHPKWTVDDSRAGG